ncbi:MAG: OmpA family protein [Bacteroidota bacterium]
MKYRFYFLTISAFLFIPYMVFSQGCPEITNKKAIKAYQKGASKYLEARKSNSNNQLYSEAIEALMEAIELEPNFPDAYYLLGEYNYKKDNVTAAEKNLRKAYEACPDFPELNLYYYLGDICFGKKNWADADRFFGLFMKDKEKAMKHKKYADADFMYQRANLYHKLISNPVAFDPKPVAGISTKQDEYLPIITPDDEFAFFTRKYEKPKQTTAWSTQGGVDYIERFSMAQRINGKFNAGAELPPPFNLTPNEGGATFTIDNRYLFYTICKYLAAAKYTNCDICMSENIEGEWSEVKNLGLNVNMADSWDSQPTISADGKVIFFVSDRKGGLGGYDIWKTEKAADGTWGKPTNLGAPINTPGNERAPFIHTDSQTLYFTSADRYDEGTDKWFDGHLGLGGYDIFFAKMNNDGTWQKPTNIGYPINSEDDESGFFVSTDSKTGFFASDKAKYGGVGGYDIYSFELYKEARPEKVLFLKGDIKEDKTNDPIRAKVELISASTKEITEIPVDSVTGRYVIAIKFKDDYVMTVKKDGYAYNAKYISKEDSIYEAPKKMDFDVQKIEVGTSYKLNDIYYATNSTDLMKSSKIIIDGFADFLKTNPSITVAIHGHTDNVGSDSANLVLSEGRAKSVFDYMVSKGVAHDRLSYKGHGESKPVATNDTPEGRAINRRTEFEIVSK